MRNALLLIAILGVLPACGSGNAPGAANANADTNTPALTPRMTPDEARAGQSRDALARARDLRRDGKLEAAITEGELAAELDPANGMAFAWLGDAYTEAGRHLEAARAHRQAARLAKDERDRADQTYRAGGASRAVARAAFARGHYKMAAEHARDAVKANELDAEARRVLADSLFHAGLHAEARPEYQRLADESAAARRQENLYWVGVCGLYLKEYDAAEAVFSTLIKEGYKDGDVYLWRGRCRFSRGDRAGARQDLRLAMEFATSDEQRQAAQDFLNELEKGE